MSGGNYTDREMAPGSARSGAISFPPGKRKRCAQEAVHGTRNDWHRPWPGSERVVGHSSISNLYTPITVRYGRVAGDTLRGVFVTGTCMTRDECKALILRAMDGDVAAWETIRSSENSFLIPLSMLDDADRSKVDAFFRTTDADAVLDAIDPRWAEEHPAEMKGIATLGKPTQVG
jgi:hypothetical protein